MIEVEVSRQTCTHEIGANQPLAEIVNTLGIRRQPLGVEGCTRCGTVVLPAVAETKRQRHPFGVMLVGGAVRTSLCGRATDRHATGHRGFPGDGRD
jgi:hypothetical protein